MIVSIITFNYEEKFFKQASDIRYQVLVDELKYSKFNEFDSFDFTSIHFLVFLNQKPIASARAREFENKFLIEKIAVLKPFRSKSIGSLLLRFIIDDIKNAKKEIVLSCENKLKSFFESHGFIQIGNNEIDSFLQMKYNKAIL